MQTKFMNEIERQILEDYARDFNVESKSYQMLGMMLDENFVKNRLKMFNINHMYIYGGTYMAIQLYRIGKKYTDIKGVVDKSGKLIIYEDVSVLLLNELKKVYDNEKIIITPIRYFQEITKELEQFVNSDNIISIGELLLGII